MTLGYADFRALVEALQAHPEWRAELRRLVLTEELLELPTLVRELAEAQRRSEERITRLEEAVAALAEAQRRTEQRVEELAEAQRRTEERVSALKTTVDKLQQTFGATLEEEAASVIEAVLRKKGFRLLAPAVNLAVNGEIDVLALFEDPQGQRVWAVIEVKARLSRSDVYAWVQRMRAPGWQQRLVEKGVEGSCYLYFYAIRVDVGALQLIDAEGVGLLKSDGEIIPPKKQLWISKQATHD
ncbi:MAG: YraN family protein [Thermoflexales bacterium]|nr:YraN family protein [Thermoflexales bacterium]